MCSNFPLIGVGIVARNVTATELPTHLATVVMIAQVSVGGRTGAENRGSIVPAHEKKPRQSDGAKDSAR